jgi:tripartite-type tricarboxylate transporter receptor subunit TctC
MMSKARANAFPAAGAALMLAVLIAPVLAENYPNKPIRLILGFPPGGTNDIIARLVGQKMSERFK